MAIAFVTIGVPGSGKTTFVRKMVADMKVEYISPDQIRIELTGRRNDHTKEALVWKTVYGNVCRALKRGANVVIDATNARWEHRRSLVSSCNRYATKVVGLWFVTPDEECARRNAQRSDDSRVPDHAMQRMFRELKQHPPSTKEFSGGMERIDTSL